MEIRKIEVESRVAAVTVYQGRAMISRKTAITLEAGKHTVIFPDLPANLDRDSIQVKGIGDAVLGECSFETEFFSEDVDARKQHLLKRQQQIMDNLADKALLIAASEKERGFIEKIATYITTPAGHNTGPAAEQDRNGTVVPDQLAPSTWEGLLNFYHDKNTALDTSTLQSERQAREIKKELEKVNSELENLGFASERSRNIIKVSLSKEAAGDVTLELSYMISGPSWRPVYNLRAAHDRDNLSLEYDALINQGTGEDWDGVDLKLSTARVNVAGTLPDLQPWRLHFYRPAPGIRRAKSKRMGDEEDMLDEMAKKSAAEYPAASKMAMAAEPIEMYIEEAGIDAAGASVVFTVAGGGNINGDNSDTRVSLMRRDMEADFHYASVPKLSEFAYLTARARNTTDFPLLPGKANIFFDGSFISTSELSLIMPDQELDVSLGVDEGVNIKYRYLKRFKKNEGLMNKRISEQFEYQIRITNNLVKEIDIKVFDQFPIPEEKDISVKRLSPVIKDNQKDISIDDESKIQWQIKLGPGQIRELPYSFLVEYPAGSCPPGL